MLPKTICTFVLLAGAATSAIAGPAKPSSGKLHPCEITIYNVGTGSQSCSKDGSAHICSNGQDKTTLLTYDIPDSLAGYKCQLDFCLGSGSTSGSSRLQLYDSIATSPACAQQSGYIANWPPSNWRGKNIGDLTVLPTGSSPITSYGDSLVKVQDCPAGQRIAYELVGQGDDVAVKFNGSSEGLMIAYWK